MSVSPPPDEDHGLDGNMFLDAENDPDCIRFLLASDNHIGYMEKDPVRGPDAINTFKEILHLAIENEVDFILLGGDLFHDNKPSRLTMHQVIALLREHTMGDRPISVELRSDAGRGYKEGYTFPSVNYADENINVGTPVFSIHGNHDDPQGSGAGGSLSALDILSAAGLITYFGRTDLPSDDAAAAAPADRTAAADEADPGIRLKPILLQKGGTKLALYGLGNIRDERLHFELRGNRVRLQRPAEDTDEWFNLLVLHQNRAKHNLKAAVPEGLFDDSTHLVVWGHEHECRMTPEVVTGKQYRICQPGSSVATSLSPGETAEKSVAIVMVKGQDYRVNPIKLKTVRPFIMDELDLEAELGELNIKADDKEKITKVLRDKVNQLVNNAVKSWDAEHADENPKPERMLPLVRLRVIYTNQVVGNPVRFGQDFAGRVANPKEVLQFHKKMETTRRARNEDAVVDLDDRDIMAAERLERVQISTLMKQFLLQQNMQILNPKEIQDATLKYAEKDNKEALTEALDTFLTHIQASLSEVSNEDELYRKIDSIRQRHYDNDEEDDDEGNAADGGAGTAAEGSKSAKGKAPARGTRAASDDSMLQDMDVDDEEEDAAPAPSSRKGKGKAPARSPAKKTGRAAAARASREEEEDDDDGDDVVEAAPPPKSRTSALSSLGGKKSATTRSPAKKAAAAPKKPADGMRQSQLAFGGATSSSGSRSRTAAKKAQAKISNAVHDEDENEDEDEVVDDEDDEGDDDRDGQSYAPRGGKKNTAVIEIDDSEDDAPPPPPKKRRPGAKR
ncbi:unnamed protein product [Tilletia caries]|nr:hypothetical protein CF335_g111 [Tilletia laevis]CAD6889108.1 unnamed protein product [Tilletia caries]